MSGSTYRILDEPLAGQRRLPALNPFWPLLGMMFGGAWLGAATFIFNAIALRGPAMSREIGLAITMLLGSLLLVVAIGFAVDRQWISEGGIKYSLLAIVAWKLGLAYWIYFSQQQAHAIYEYFERGHANPQLASVGPALVILGSLLKAKVVGASSSVFWILTVN